MYVIAVVDDRYGLMFNHRRLSSDRVLTDRIKKLSAGSVLRMDPYSASLFAALPENAAISEDFLEAAGEDDFCFVENVPLLPYAGRISRFYLYHWNRSYPSDFRLDFIPQEEGMKLYASEDFAGYSHEKITGEVWRYA